MHLAILMCNTDESDFAHRHPLDGQKFSDLVHLVRPGWTQEVFAVKDGVFPGGLSGFDGTILTGSPASVLSDAPWVARLLALVREMYAARLPMFGACFGHQAIALALGGQIGANPAGWFHGLSVNEVVARPGWMRDLPDMFRLYASHKEQVVALPDGAQVVSRAKGCDVSGFAMGGHVFATQQHPEMTRGFMLALTQELAPDLGDDLASKALESLAEPTDTRAFAECLARFFEQAAGQGES